MVYQPVVVREGMVVVMPALSHADKADQEVLCRVETFVVRPSSPHVSKAVDGPDGVQAKDVAQAERDEERGDQRLSPQIHR